MFNENINSSSTPKKFPKDTRLVQDISTDNLFKSDTDISALDEKIKYIFNHLNERNHRNENIDRMCENLQKENEDIKSKVNELELNFTRNIAESKIQFEKTTYQIQDLTKKINILKETQSDKIDVKDKDIVENVVKSLDTLKFSFTNQFDILLAQVNNLSIQNIISSPLTGVVSQKSLTNVNHSCSNTEAVDQSKGDTVSGSIDVAAPVKLQQEVRLERNVTPSATVRAQIPNPNEITPFKPAGQKPSVVNNQSSDTFLNSVSTHSQATTKPPVSITGQNTNKPSLFGYATNKTEPAISKATPPLSQSMIGSVPSGNRSLFGSTEENKSTSIFGNTGNENKSPFAIAIGEPKPLFGSNNDSCLFSTKSDMPSFSSLTNKECGFGFGSTEMVTWKTGGKLFENSVAAANRTTEDAETAAAGADDTVDEECSAHYEPIVDLPPLVSLSKDEDSSDVLFRSRGKLFRFVNGEWKERGLGEMKVLRTKASVDANQPARLVMRREQVGKLCCNHAITKQCPVFTHMTEKSACWFAQDYSDGEAVKEKFAIKFGKEVILEELKSIIKNIQNEIV